MTEHISELQGLESDTDRDPPAANKPASPGVKVDLHVEKNYGTVIGTQVTQIIQPRTFRLPLQRPPRAEHFIGREAELAQLLQNIQPGRIVTLCGPGGIGKTALAAEAIWSLAPGNDPPERFPDGIIFHNFNKQPQATLALENIARIFGEEPRPSPRDAAQRVLAGRKALIVLDSAEEADDLPLVLQVCGGCGVLVTSRSRKDAAEACEDISSLPLDVSEKLLKSWGRERAKPDEAVHQICELLGGLALAVRLAGRYLAEAGLNAPEYLSWLKDTPLEALDTGKRREESVPLLIDRSMERLSDTARHVLGIVGLLAPDPFERDVIRAGLELSVGEQIKALGELINYGILLRRGQFYEVGHNLIYTYSRSRYQVDEEVFQRLTTYFLNFTRNNGSIGPDGYARLDIERVHILKILKACNEREKWETSVSLAWALDDYLDLSGYWTERLEAVKNGLESSKQLKDPENESAFLDKLGITYTNLGQAKRAIEHYELALAISRETGNQQTESAELGNLGNVHYSLGQVKRAIKYYEQSLAIAREIGDQRSEGDDLGNLGNAYYSLGQVERAIDYHEKALAIVRQIGDRRGECYVLGNLGTSYSKLGHVEHAIEFYEQALAITRQIGDRYGESAVLGNLGNAYYSLSQEKRAIEYHQQALAIAREIGDRRGELADLGNLGNAYRALDQVEQAVECYEQALAIAREIGDRRAEAIQSRYLSSVYKEKGDLPKAMAAMQDYLDWEAESGNPYFKKSSKKVNEFVERLINQMDTKGDDNDEQPA